MPSLTKDVSAVGTRDSMLPPPLLEVIGGEGIQGCSSRVGENIERRVVILRGEYIQGGNSGS